MDETVYQCPECNFNADNLHELDSHIIDNHSNENQSFTKNNSQNFRLSNKNYSNGYSNSLSTQNDEMTLRDDEDFDENNDIENFEDDDDFFNERNNINKENGNEEYQENGYGPNDASEFPNDDDEDFFQNTENTENAYQDETENVDENYYQQNNFSITIAPKKKRINSTTTVQNTSTNGVKFRPIKPHIPLPDGPVINSDNHYERQYTCKRCDFFTNNPRAVLYHRKEFHMEKINVHECQYCQYASQYSGKVERHTLLRHKIDMTNNKFTPNKLNKSELNDSNVLNQSTNLAKNDLNNSQNQQVSKFQCNKCPCKYKRSSDLTKHMRLKHSVNPNQNDFTKIIATAQIKAEGFNEENEDFENSASLNETQNSQNRSAYLNRNFNQIQKKIINSEVENGLKTQSQLISNPNPNTYQCPYCTFYTNLDQSNEYLLHVKDHLCGKAFRCVLCNSVYKYRGDCVVHLKRKHQKADMIAHSYVDKFNLDNLNINDIYGLLKPKEIDEPENEEKLYGCSYCDYKANYKGDVYKHQTRRHPGTVKSVLSLATQNTTVLSNCSSENNSVNNSFNQGNNNTLNNTQNGFTDDQENQNFYSQQDETAADEDIIQDDEEDFFNEKNQNGYEDEMNGGEYNDNYEEYTENFDENFNENHNEIDDKTLVGPDVKNKCKFCPFVGRSQAKVLLHMATHYNLKQYMCPICKKRANFKWDIQKHMRKIHNDYQSEVVILSENEARQSIGNHFENPIENSSSGSNLSIPQKLSQFYETGRVSGNSSPLIYNGLNMSPAIGSDSTGNKKFRCTVCPYRSNWKADMYRHLRKRHSMAQPKIEDVVVLTPDEAASTLEEYERLHGINIRKRARFDDVYRSSVTSSASNDGFGSDHTNDAKRFKNDSSSVVSTSDEQNQFGSGMEDEGVNDSDEGVNGPLESDTNYESDNYSAQNGVERLPVSIAELNIKPYQCLKCGFRSDRKSDTLRHIRVKHSVQPLQAFKFLRILSIKEASETIDEYESTRLYKKVKPNTRDYALINTLVKQTNQNLDPNSALSNLKYLAKNQNGQPQTPPQSFNSQYITSNPVQIHRPNPLNNQYSTRSNVGLNLPIKLPPINGHNLNEENKKEIFDYYKCPYCSFKHKSRVCMKKHLSNHFFANHIKQNIVYKCSACNFKSDWQYTCKKHILTCHLTSGLDARVIKVNPKNMKQKAVQKTQESVQRSIKILIKRNENGNSAEIIGKQESQETEMEHEMEHETEHESENIEKNDFYNDQENDVNQLENSMQEDRKTRILVNDEDKKYQESVVLTGYDGLQFTATYFVSNACVFNGSQNGANGVPIGKKTKMFYCQNCPYKTNNYCTFKQHLLQHKFRDGFYKCRYCPYYVSMIRLLKQHEIIHTEYAPRESCSLESAQIQNKSLEAHQMPIAQ